VNRLTVPAGINKVKTLASIRWDDNSPDADGTERLFYTVHRDSSDTIVAYYSLTFAQGTPTSSIEQTGMTTESPVVDVNEGDWFEVWARQQSGGDLSTYAAGGAGSTQSFFSIEVKDPVTVTGIASGGSSVSDPLVLASGVFSESLTISGVPVATGTSLFRGAMLTTSSGINVINGASLKEIPWDGAEYDTDGFLDTALDSIVIPAGVSRVQLSAQLLWENNTAGRRQAQLYKNNGGPPGTPVDNRLADTGSGSYFSVFTSAILSVDEGDVFTIKTWQNSGSDLTINSNAATWFQIEVKE
jgi:hypothetical protein